MPKQTRLDESAAIYQQRKKQSEKEKLKDMNLRNKMAYLWEYYHIVILLITAAIIIAIYTIYSILTPNVHPRFYAAIVNSNIITDQVQEYGQDFADYLQLDPKTENVIMNDNLTVSMGSDFATNMQEVLTAYIASREVDVIIAPETDFKGYIQSEYFINLSDELPTDVYSMLTDYFYLSSAPSDPEQNAYGIYLSDTDLFQDASYNDDPYILGIVANYTHKEDTVKFIKYLFKNLND